MTRRQIQVELAGHASLVRGHGSRELYLEVTAGRPPLWVSRSRGWACQEKTARNIAAAAEARGYDVVVTGRRMSQAQLTETALPEHVVHLPEVSEQADPGQGLW